MTWLKLAVDIAQVVMGVATVCLLYMTWEERKEKIQQTKELERQKRLPKVNVTLSKTLYDNSFPGLVAPYFLDITFLPCEEPLIIKEIETLWGGFLNGGYTSSLSQKGVEIVSTSLPQEDNALLVPSLDVSWILPASSLSNRAFFTAYLLCNDISAQSMDRRVAMLRFRDASKNIAIQVRITISNSSIISIDTSNNPTVFSDWEKLKNQNELRSS
ncbi:hypothetical protein [Parasutterella excrementihominis]|uniref:hypothetical protein n=1 Tax=Parasutterella excrementihominis TaxID=487175 RepID=UPI0012BD4202|nr:hypothetical protein [Parasutterella excrementihominis]MTT66034.1 hypothetical protein [Parasutterella excrementihominis]MTT94230.1 hypothetical protein [Parasutterella excrementihominis]